MNIKLLEGERIDDLQHKGMKIIQHDKKFCFGTDAVLLSHFSKVRRNDKVVELGAGTGVISLLLAANYPYSTYTGVEVQPYMANMAARSVIMNDLAERITIVTEDLKTVHNTLGHGCCDMVVCNPPYGAKGATITNMDKNFAISKHEIMCTLDDVVKASFKLLKNMGRLYLIYPAVRINQVLSSLTANRIEPKKLQLVYHRIGSRPKFLLVESVKGSKPGLIWEKPVFMHDADGQYTDKMKEIYHIED